jgi:hypothetical protein
MYTSDRLDRNPKVSVKEQVLEIAMFDLDRTAMQHFYGATYASISDSKDCKEREENVKHAGALATGRSGIGSIFPDFDIDYHLFSPCGYSCNGLKDEFYFTIHVTPESHCSFVSFETNVSLSDYAQLIAKVLSIFRPGRFCVLTAEDGVSLSSMGWWFDGFASVATTHLRLNASTTVISTQFIKSAKHKHERVDLDSPQDSSDTDGVEKTDKKKKRKKRCKKKKKKTSHTFARNSFAHSL